MIKQFLFLILLSVLFQCSSQKNLNSKFINNSSQIVNQNYLEYYKKIYIGDSLYLIGRYNESFKIFDDTFKKFKPKNQYQIEEIEKYIILADKLQKPINYSYYFELLYKESVFNNLKMNYETETIFNKQKISKIELDKWKMDFDKEKNNEYLEELKLMFKEDQKSRGKNTEWEIDERNYQKFIELYHKFGYPEKATTHEGKSYLQIIFFHLSRVDEFATLKSIVLENLKIGKATPEEAKALISSKYLIFYNYNYFEEEEVNRNFLNLIKSNTSIDTINLRRYNIGLPSKNYEDWKNANFR